MEFTTDERFTICQGIRNLIAVREHLIEKTKRNTESDYKLLKSLRGEEFSLEEAIQNDVEEIKKQITELEQLLKKVNNGESRLLLVPKFIQLRLSGE